MKNKNFKFQQNTQIVGGEEAKTTLPKLSLSQLEAVVGGLDNRFNYYRRNGTTIARQKGNPANAWIWQRGHSGRMEWCKYYGY
ncbi:MAG: hypothetical protein QNJ54_29765 [Prochloraceae cyanobacterium]|nr:hypothetical protein [Prochloraceae cyanobacterium]